MDLEGFVEILGVRKCFFCGLFENVFGIWKGLGVDLCGFGKI